MLLLFHLQCHSADSFCMINFKDVSVSDLGIIVHVIGFLRPTIFIHPAFLHQNLQYRLFHLKELLVNCYAGVMA